ncbi:MAG: site-specific integrase [Rhabdochlamydiaceae bacterium]|nr:site-specific integrase [Rhabdochlamydiaceae bacterium]
MARKRINSKSKEGQAYEQLITSCLSLSSEHDLTKLDALKTDVSHFSEDLHKQVESFKQAISKMPLSVFVILWADSVFDEKSSYKLELMRDLIETKLVSLSSLEKLAKLDPSFILEKIRCCPEWTLNKREDAVLLYTSFASWLSQETFAFVAETKDLDRLATQKRQVPFDLYIKILSHLDLREQILAKMFYLGGNRGLEEVLSVKIEDIDFKKASVHLSETVLYPRHLFSDIESYIQGRKKGYLFLGKEGERISHTTPFRALKKVVSKMQLDPEFTFRELVRNR